MGSHIGNHHFQVDWGGDRIGCMEVSGLGIELDVVAYRDGASRDNAASLLPGQRHFSPIVLRRAIVQGDNGFFEWINSARFEQVERRDVTVSLLNESHEPIVTWRIVRAFPSRLDYATLHAQGSGLATESLTLVHEGLVVEHR